MVKRWAWVVGVSLLPFIVLLLRGFGWGSDSFAFYSVACGQSEYTTMLSSNFFAFFLPMVSCNFVLISFLQWLFYLGALLSLWEIGKSVLGDHAWLLPVYTGTLTPLFFLEGLRFENDLFGWSLMFMAIGLFSLSIRLNKPWKWLGLSFSAVLGLFSINIWAGSIILTPIALLLTNIKEGWKHIILGVALYIALFYQLGYILGSFNLNLTSIVSEEIPLLGLVFILPILHYWNKIPSPFKLYGLMLLALGILKSKYMFLATPFLIMAMILKEKKEGLWLKDLKIEPLFFVALFSLCYFTFAFTLYPTSQDTQEIKSLISNSSVTNTPIYNDWGNGWLFTYLGYPTQYKSSPPGPDWNNLERPYFAYTIEQLDCNKISKKIYYCN